MNAKHTLDELIKWCDAMSIDNECGPYWQSQFRCIRDTLMCQEALLEALKTVIWAEDNQPDHREDAIRHARAAIAKAEGRTE